MGYKAIIYGRIEGASDPSKEEFAPFRGSLYHHNRCVIQGLPDTDSEWPFLSRHMFSLALPTLEWNYDRGIYKTQIIHFGASLKVGFSDTDFVIQWLDKFEQQLLKPLVWFTAVVHFEHEVAGKCIVSYDAKLDSVRQVFEEFRAVGSRVEANIEWVRHPETPNEAFNREESIWFEVSWDAEFIYRNVSPPGKESWSDKFKWSDIVKVCFEATAYRYPIDIYFYTSERPEGYVIPTQAKGGSELWNLVIEKGLFDPQLALEAASAVSGLFCWPKENS